VAVPVLAGTVALGLVVATAALDDPARTAVANLGSLALALGAAGACGGAARRSRGRLRGAWAALALAAGSWGAGQVVWTAAEAAGRAVPFPSLADVGFLGFPVAALVGLALLTPRGPGLSTPRRVLDAVMVGCALALLAWLTVVEPITSAFEPFTAGVALAYPLSDIVLLTVAVLTVAQTREEPLLWALLAAALLAMGVSDAAFSYATAAGTYTSGTPVDWGWWTAFALLATAGALVGRGRPPERRPPPPEAVASARLLPYLPLGAAVVVAAAAAADGSGIDGVTVALVVVLVGLVLGRQYAAVRESQRLAVALQQRERELAHLAFHDALTGLANRALFLDRLAKALDRTERGGAGGGGRVTVVYCDLDGFKAVNDALGHAVGDALLVRVAERLGGAVRAGDTLARLGGDEFAVLVESGDGGSALARRLLTALREPIHLDGRAVTVSASIGVATAGPGTAAGTLLHRADVAMYAVKSAGKDGVLVHGPAMDALRHRDGVGRDDALHAAFAAALRDGSVRAVYQPVVDPVTGRIGALEALARWTHRGTEVAPAVFVPLATRGGLSGPFTALMLEQAAAQLARWNAGLGHRRLRVAVNIDPVELTDAGLPARIAQLVARHGLAHGQLIAEITESSATHRPDTAADVLVALREAGARVALDDFGTGFSTLARLSSTPVDTVKIDRFFVADIDHDVHQKRFLVGLFELTRHLGVRTVAEGVERPGQLRELQRLGCDFVQGHLVARPAPPEEFTPLLLSDAVLLPPALLPASAAAGVGPLLEA
jgi:diguanylate cyclase (GGDEF)-like protein